MELKSKLVVLVLCVGAVQGSIFNFVSRYMGFLRATPILDDWPVSDCAVCALVDPGVGFGGVQINVWGEGAKTRKNAKTWYF